MTPAEPMLSRESSPDVSDQPSRCDLPQLGLAVLIALVPVWAFHFFPTTDGGAHLANADVLLQYFRPASDAYRKYYQLSHAPLPNSLGHFLLAAFMLVFPPLLAEKLFVSLYLILLPLALRYAVTAVNRSSAFLAILAVPLSLNWIFHQGFYNFCCSVAIFFFATGYWLRRREQMNAKRVIVLALLALLLYAGHLLSIVLFIAAIGILALWFSLAQWLHPFSLSPGAPGDRDDGNVEISNLKSPLPGSTTAPHHPILGYQTKGGVAGSLWPGFRSRALLTFVALLPAIALFLWFQVRGFAGKPAGAQLAILDRAFWKDLLSMSILVSFRARFERPFAITSAALVGALTAYALVRRLRTQTWNRLDGLLFVPVAFAALYFTRGGDESARLFIPQRLIYYTYLTTFLFLAAQPYAIWLKRVVQSAALVLVVGLTAVHWRPIREYNLQLTEFVGAAEKIETGSTLLPLIFSPRGLPAASDTEGLRVTPFYTAAGYAAVDRRAIDLRNYEAGLDYFPVRFRAELNPYKYLGDVDKKLNGLDDVPQRFDVARYEKQPGARVDYVLVWGVTDTARENPLTTGTYAQLRAGYDLIETSPSRRTELWRRKMR